MKIHTASLFAFLLAATAPAAAQSDSVQPVIVAHDFERGPETVREHFNALYAGTAHSRFQPHGCTAGDSLYAFKGRPDREPVQIERIMLLEGNPTPLTSPVYLVSGRRSMWFENHQAYVDLLCTWMVVFEGEDVRAVREAPELSYLFRELQ